MQPVAVSAPGKVIRDHGCGQHSSGFRVFLCAGSVSGMLAALTAAVAFTAIKFVPRGEPTVVLAMWFHCSALAMSIIPLAVRTF